MLFIKPGITLLKWGIVMIPYGIFLVIVAMVITSFFNFPKGVQSSVQIVQDNYMFMNFHQWKVNGKSTLTDKEMFKILDRNKDYYPRIMPYLIKQKKHVDHLLNTIYLWPLLLPYYLLLGIFYLITHIFPILGFIIMGIFHLIELIIMILFYIIEYVLMGIFHVIGFILMEIFHALWCFFNFFFWVIITIVSLIVLFFVVIAVFNL
jgi:hypothetical protein